jgi:hypothetical protein
MSYIFKKLCDGWSDRKIFVQLMSVMICSFFWISWFLKLRPIGCLKPSVRNYHFALCNTPEECRSHMIWWCRPWFGSVCSGSERSGLSLYVPVQSDLVWLCMFRFRAIWFGCVCSGSERSGLAVYVPVQSDLVWLCMFRFRAIWFGSVCSGTERSGLARCNSALHTRI